MIGLIDDPARDSGIPSPESNGQWEAEDRGVQRRGTGWLHMTRKKKDGDQAFHGQRGYLQIVLLRVAFCFVWSLEFVKGNIWKKVADIRRFPCQVTFCISGRCEPPDPPTPLLDLPCHVSSPVDSTSSKDTPLLLWKFAVR